MSKRLFRAISDPASGRFIAQVSSGTQNFPWESVYSSGPEFSTFEDAEAAAAWCADRIDAVVWAALHP